MAQRGQRFQLLLYFSFFYSPETRALTEKESEDLTDKTTGLLFIWLFICGVFSSQVNPLQPLVFNYINDRIHTQNWIF